MNRLLLASTTLIALGTCGAEATDLPLKAPAPPPVVAPSWTGFYIGAMASERVADVDFTTTGVGTPLAPPNPVTAAGSFGNTSIRGGGYAGYNLQTGTFVFGIEGDVAAGNNDVSKSGVLGAVLNAPADSTRVRLTWDASIRGRLGLIVTPGVMLFGTAGGAFQNLEATVNCIVGAFCVAGSKSETFSSVRTGWTAGAGLEALLSDHWTGKLEYRFADYGRFGHTFFSNVPADVLATRINLVTHTVTIGIALKFGGGAW